LGIAAFAWEDTYIEYIQFQNIFNSLLSLLNFQVTSNKQANDYWVVREKFLVTFPSKNFMKETRGMS